MTLVQGFNRTLPIAAKDLPDIVPGAIVKVYQKIIETTEKGKKERTQIFEGLVIAKRGSMPSQCTITVRKVSNGVGVERIFPLISPVIEKIELVRRMKVRRAKLYYMRDLRGRASRLKAALLSEKELAEVEKKQAEERMIREAKHAKAHAKPESEAAAAVVAAPDQSAA